jgi:hypothetical protein
VGAGSDGTLRQELQHPELPNKLDCFEADGDHLADEADDVFRIVGAVRVVDDAGAGVGGDAVLVDDPLKGAAVAEFVFVNVGRDAAEGEEIVVTELGFVLGEGHFLDFPVELADFGAFQRVLGLFFVADVQVHQLFADFRVGPKVGSEGDAGQLALKVSGVAGSVLGVVERSVRGMQSKELRGRFPVID